MEHLITAPDGRRLCVSDVGVPDGPAVIYLHGMPGSRRPHPRDVGRAERLGFRLLSYDRPGYGGSDRHEGRTVADCASDVRAIAEGLGVDRLAVWGISGGGPHALACAALLGDLVPAVGVLASSAPWDAEGLDYLAGTGELNVEDTLLFFSDRAAARAKCERDREEMLALDAGEVREFTRTLLSPVDAAAMTGELAELLLAAQRVGLAPGSDGWWDDTVAHLEPWGFDIRDIRTPVRLLHGRHDQFVPVAHGEWLAARIPGVDALVSDEDGHLTLPLNHGDALYEWLLARM